MTNHCIHQLNTSYYSVCASLLMAQVLIIGILTFLLLQLTAGQDACTNALATLANNAASCAPTPENPTIICSGVCRGYYEDIFNKCSPEVSQAVST